MADLAITASAVLAGANATKASGTAGATVTAGQVVYKVAATGRYALADADHATAAVRQPAGIALNGASDGQPIDIITAGDLTVNAVLTAGTVYYLSPSAGGIAPLADVLSGDDVVVIGIARSTTVLKVAIQIPGVTL
jgi:hypothetical protein